MDWIEYNEDMFKEDPEYYFRWRKTLSGIMLRKGVKYSRNMLRPQLKTRRARVVNERAVQIQQNKAIPDIRTNDGIILLGYDIRRV